MEEFKIGRFTITRQEDGETYEIKYEHHNGGYSKTEVVGGDFETVLEPLFIGNDVETKWSHQIED